jgi:hypothetical protein
VILHGRLKTGGSQCEASPRKKQEILLWVWQVVEYLLSKCEALSANPSTAKKAKQNKTNTVFNHGVSTPESLTKQSD